MAKPGCDFVIAVPVSVSKRCKTPILYHNGSQLYTATLVPIGRIAPCLQTNRAAGEKRPIRIFPMEAAAIRFPFARSRVESMISRLKSMEM